MKLDYVQALKRITEARGAWIIHGQEPLLEQNLLDGFRKVGNSMKLNVSVMTSVASMIGKMFLMR
jgi:hypothetical protein